MRINLTKYWLVTLLVLLSLEAGCGRSSNPVAKPKQTEPAYVPGEGAVAFDISNTKADAGKRSWLATYRSDNRAARFVIELNQSLQPIPYFAGFGKGRFVAENGSDASSLLAALAKALEAKRTPKKSTRVTSLPFEFVSFGNNVPRFADGSFGPNGQGDWIAIKVFLRGDEGEVFLNLNPVIGKGEFTIKDPDYGDIVLAELAKVL